MHELKVHVRGALNNGVTKEALQQIFLHASVYCGFPAAVDAFRTAAEVIDAPNRGHVRPNECTASRAPPPTPRAPTTAPTTRARRSG